jgi:hypothetical protein
MDMVGVSMGQENGIEAADCKAEQLFAKIWRQVDENLCLGTIFFAELYEK